MRTQSRVQWRQRISVAEQNTAALHGHSGQSICRGVDELSAFRGEILGIREQNDAHRPSIGSKLDDIAPENGSVTSNDDVAADVDHSRLEVLEILSASVVGVNQSALQVFV